MSTSSISLGGMNAALNALDSSAWCIARQAAQSPAQAATSASATKPNTASEPTLEDNVVSQLQAKNAFLVNLRVFQASDEMLGALVNVKA
jgi:hypothetical protein